MILIISKRVERERERELVHNYESNSNQSSFKSNIIR